MSFVPNDVNNEQISLFDSFSGLTEREQRVLSKSWAKPFAEIIFPAIDETPFAVLYSTKDSRPNTPVNVLVGASVLQQLTGQSDEEINDSLMFDIRFQYALHTTNFQEQPLSDRSLGRFRARCNAYYDTTGIDLLHDAVMALTDEMAALMKLDHQLKRMDSMMVASNIKKMSRLELLYTCVSNLVRKMKRLGLEFPEDLNHYIEDNDRNAVIYHNRSEETTSKIDTVLNDIKTLLPLCEGKMDDTSEYLLFIRAIKEQTVADEAGNYRLRTAADGGMDSNILQNPADPDATYRSKAGKEYRGYTANVVEETNGSGNSLVTDYQFEQNNYSDKKFMEDVLNGMPSQKQEEPICIITDGAFTCEDELAAEKNVEIIRTNLTGKDTPDIHAEFEFNEQEDRIIRCPGGFTPRSCSYNGKNGQCTASFERSNCESCPYRDRCNPKWHKRTCQKVVSGKSRRRAIQQRTRSSEEFKAISAFRNGIETIPSILRRKYGVDHMPVRGKTRCRYFFGCKIAALNIKKFCKYLQGLGNCAQNVEPA